MLPNIDRTCWSGTESFVILSCCLRQGIYLRCTSWASHFSSFNYLHSLGGVGCLVPCQPDLCRYRRERKRKKKKKKRKKKQTVKLKWGREETKEQNLLAYFSAVSFYSIHSLYSRYYPLNFSPLSELVVYFSYIPIYWIAVMLLHINIHSPNTLLCFTPL